MGASFEGLPQIQQRLKEMVTSREFNKMVDESLKEGAKVVVDELAKELKVMKKYATGATIKEITVGKAKAKKGARTLQIGWNGPKERWRLVHLNEFGYDRNGKFYGPQLDGYMKITKSVEQSRKDYVKTVHKEMRKHYERHS